MRELIYFIATSIDGRIADAEGGVEAFVADPEFLQVLAEEYPESLPAHARAALGARLDPQRSRWTTVLMGRRTYEPALSVGILSPYAPFEQVVVSRSLRSTGGAGDPIVVDYPLATVRRLKAEGEGGIWLCGGGELAGALADEIDRLVIKVNPIVLGEGRPLFAGPSVAGRWRLTGVRRLPGDVVLLEYDRDR